MNIPKYKTYAGLYSLEGALGKNDCRIRISNSMVQEFYAYQKDLEADGFRLLAKREIPSACFYGDSPNVYYAYEKDGTVLHAFWDAVFHTAYLTTDIGAYPLAVSQSERVQSPAFTQFNLSGMCYIVQLADGSFVLVDGGDYKPEDADKLFAFLQSRAMGKPRIRLWLFTHADSDHILLAADFIARYKAKVDIEAFAYQFPDVNKITVTMQDNKKILGDIQTLETAIQKSYPNAMNYPLHTGQHYAFSGAELEILWTVDNLYPITECTSLNNLSAACRFRFDNGESVLILGDCMQEECDGIARLYGAYLKSDYMQVTHHGLIGGSLELYRLVDPKVCFWPISKTRFLGEQPQNFQWCLGEGGCEYNAYLRDEGIRKREHYHAGETVTVKFE